MPEAGSPQHARVLQYRELLDALPMDAYTHGCILHPELTTDSMIPKYATAEIRSECCPSEPPSFLVEGPSSSQHASPPQSLYSPSSPSPLPFVFLPRALPTPSPRSIQMVRTEVYLPALLSSL